MRRLSPQQQIEHMLEGLRQQGMTCRDIGRETGMAASTVWKNATGCRQPSYAAFKKIERIWIEHGSPAAREDEP